MVTKFTTREEWLIAATKLLNERIFSDAGEVVPAVKLSVGWPGGRGKKNAVIGQCWSPAVAADDVSHVFISPVLSDSLRVLDVLAHELIHAINYAEGDECGHKGRFAKIAKTIGLTGKMTATVAGEELSEMLSELLIELGEYPHGALLASAGDGADGPKRQGTRMLKIECAQGSGYIVRMTRKWLDELGTPTCPCHSEQMIEAL